MPRLLSGNATFVAILILAFLTSAKKVKCFCLAVNLKVHPFPHLSQVSHLEHIQDVCDEDILVEHVEGEDLQGPTDPHPQEQQQCVHLLRPASPPVVIEKGAPSESWWRHLRSTGWKNVPL